MIRTEVTYKLDDILRSKIVKVKKEIVNELINVEIYLFGSIAKGKYSKRSDIDILVLIDRKMEKKELREVRHLLEDRIDTISLKRDVDIKLYSKNNFIELTEKPSFEREILKDLIDIKEWEYGE